MSNDNKNDDFIKKYWPWMLCIFLLLTPILIPEFRHQIIDYHLGSNTPNEKDFLTIYITFLGVFGIIGTLIFNFQRLKRQDERLGNQQAQITLQREANIDQRFALAVETLGSKEESARTGAIYSLYHLAMEYEKYRQTVVNIISSHIRSKTNELKYIEDHSNKPTNEIQTAIDLLFKENGIHKNFHNKLNIIELDGSYLNGINFINSFCEGVHFIGAFLRGAKFNNSNCSYTNFAESHSEKAIFNQSNLLHASFEFAFLQKANFTNSILRFSIFAKSICIASDFTGVQAQFSCFHEAQCQAADFSFVHAEGIEIDSAVFHCSKFISSNFLGAKVTLAQFQCIKADNVNFQGVATISQPKYVLRFMLKKPFTLYLVDDFENRIGKDSETVNTIFEGQIDKDIISFISNEKYNEEFINDKEYQKIIDELLLCYSKHEGKRNSNNLPKGFKTGLLDLEYFKEIPYLINGDYKTYKTLYNKRRSFENEAFIDSLKKRKLQRQKDKPPARDSGPAKTNDKPQ